ncbi:hypothetical protein KJ756_00965 [Patescibacteria group bacterium]|nr:hypothetical protein [Patescibacteria group bacterium]
MLPNLEMLSFICSIFQILSLFLIIGQKWLPRFVGVFIGIGGFASVVQIFLPLANHQSMIGLIAAMCGIGLIVVGCAKTQTATIP